MVTPEQIKIWIESGLPDSVVDVAGDGHHFEAKIICPIFSGKSMLQRHRLVYQTLGVRMEQEIHALSLKTSTPEEVI
ncbi:MAG: BolA/IbaG family iron-sulfur metabolism protein [Proteobacteria bacterium]|nr:BolA/IbaG family iron-sulfur metabolism protein [Pseudomonadota bacterium]